MKKPKIKITRPQRRTKMVKTGQMIISKEKQRKLLEAHELEMSHREAGEHAGVNSKTVGNYWNRWGLKSHNKPFTNRVVQLEDLLNNVFSEDCPKESLTYDEIKARLGYLDCKVDEEDLKAKLSLCVQSGFYRKAKRAGVSRYRLVYGK